MKITSSIILLCSLFLYSGCGQKQPLPINYTLKNDDNASIRFYGTISKDDDNVNTLQNLAIEIKEGAKRLQEKGYKFFIIEPSYGVPLSITNMKALSEYCHPENAGFKVDDIDDKSSSLEEKCLPLKFGPIGAQVSLKGFSEAQFTLPTWKIEETINDSHIDNFIKAALEEGDYEDNNITFQLIQTKK